MNKGIAQNRVAQVPDVGGFVGIDAGVLDKNLLSCSRSLLPFPLQHYPRRLFSIEPCIYVTGARNLKLLEARHLPKPGDDFLSDFARRLAQLLCQFKAERQRVLTQANVRRLVDYNAW